MSCIRREESRFTTLRIRAMTADAMSIRSCSRMACDAMQSDAMQPAMRFDAMLGKKKVV